MTVFVRLALQTGVSAEAGTLFTVLPAFAVTAVAAIFANDWNLGGLWPFLLAGLLAQRFAALLHVRRTGCGGVEDVRRHGDRSAVRSRDRPSSSSASRSSPASFSAPRSSSAAASCSRASGATGALPARRAGVRPARDDRLRRCGTTSSAGWACRPMPWIRGAAFATWRRELPSRSSSQQ